MAHLTTILYIYILSTTDGTNVSSLSEVSRLNKILAKSKDFRVNELRLPNGNLTSSDEEVLECLFSTHFPGCVDITSSDDPDVFSCSYDSLASARSIVTKESIEWALNWRLKVEVMS